MPIPVSRSVAGWAPPPGAFFRICSAASIVPMKSPSLYTHPVQLVYGSFSLATRFLLRRSKRVHA